MSRTSGKLDHPYLLLTLAVLFWSGNFVLGRAVRLAVPPVGLAFWRWLGASLIISGFAWPHVKQDWPTIRRHWPILLLFAVLGVTIFNTFVYTGLQTTTALNALLLQSATPVLIVGASYLLFRQAITAQQGVGLVLSLVGVVTIVTQGDWGALQGLRINPGDLWVLGAVISWAIYSAVLRERPRLHPLSFLAVTFIPGVLLLLPVYIAENLAGRVMHLDATTLLAVGYVAIFPSVLAYFCFNRGVELAGANRAGQFMHLMPVFGSLLAMVFLGESLRLYHAFGILCIVGGIFLATR